MSTVWKEGTYAPMGHSDAELMALRQDFNTSSHNVADNLNSSTLEIASLTTAEQEDVEGEKITSHAKTEKFTNFATSPEQHVPVPDGGLTAWLQVLAGHLMNLNTWGYINSFGIFEAYYVNNLHLGASAVSWTAGMQIFLLYFIGVVSGRALDAGYYRSTVALGCAFQLSGVFMTSLCNTYWQIFLAQGVCQGIGNGLVFTPTVGLISTYFDRKRNFAMNVVLSGSVSGGFVFPLIAQHLLPKLGFAWTVRIMGFVMLFNTAVILSLARTRISPRRSGPLFELQAFKELPYTLYAIATFLILWPVYYTYDYINIYAANRIHISSSTSLTILLIFNVIGYPGRILPALLADYYLGPLNTLLLLSTGCFLLNYIWISVSSYNSLVVFTVAFGFFNGGVQGLFMSALSSLTADMSKMGTRMGMIFPIIAFSTLTGAPIAGALIDAGKGSFLAVQLFGGTSILIGIGVLVATRAAKTGWVFLKKM